LNDYKTKYGCPYCTHQKLCDRDCSFCFKNSFASHEKSKYWSDKNKCKPRDVFISSGKKYLFNCDKCKHTFEKPLNGIVGGSWCGYCAHQIMCFDEKCNHCFDMSFASYEKSKYWSDKNETKPRQHFKFAKIKCWFNCDVCSHNFESSLLNVSCGYWCPKCVNKTEKILLDFLRSKYTTTFQPKFDWCINEETKKKLPFDFLIENYKVIIELDGKQHFEQVKNWNDPLDTQKRDIHKMNLAIKNGYTVIRILQTDVYKNKIDWKKKLIKKIKEYDKPKIVFASDKKFYKCYN